MGMVRVYLIIYRKVKQKRKFDIEDLNNIIINKIDLVDFVFDDREYIF